MARWLPAAVHARSTVPDGAGGETTDWAAAPGYGAEMVQVEPLTGRELIEAQKLSTALDKRVRIRFRDGAPDPARFVLHDGRVLDQVGPRINEGERRLWLLYNVQEVR